MAENLDLPAPRKGLSEAEAFAKQEPLTSRDLVNVRNTDGRTGRQRLSKRSGRSAYVAGTFSGSSKIRAISSVTYDAKNQTYASLGDSVVISESITNPSSVAITNVAIDSQGNVYVVEGNTGLAKYNPTGTLIWKHSLPALDQYHVVREVLVDEFFNVYAATSSGGDRKKGKIWQIRQLDDNKTEVVWEIEAKRHTQKLAIKDGLLYTAQEEPDIAKAFCVVYDGIFAGFPTKKREWDLPYPVTERRLDRDHARAERAQGSGSTVAADYRDVHRLDAEGSHRLRTPRVGLVGLDRHRRGREFQFAL
jgi:outer membrane protein assembly factor BamB